MTGILFNFTAFRKRERDGFPLGKRYSRAANGELVKDGEMNLSRGNGWNESMPSLAAFGAWLNQQTPGIALTSGVIAGNDGGVYPVTTGATVATQRRRGATRTIARTGDYLHLPTSGGTLVVVDIDDSHSDRQAATIEEAHARLCTAMPELARCDMLGGYSSSSYIVSTDGRIDTGVKGLRFYFVLAEGVEYEQFKKTLKERLWLAGEMHYIPNAIGVLLERGLVDFALFNPIQPDFCAPPLLQDSTLSRNPPDRSLWHGEVPALAVYATLTGAERQAVAERQAIAKERVAAAASAIRERVRGVAESKAIAAGKTPQEASAAARRLVDGGVLPLDWQVKNAKGVWVRVGDIVANPKKYNKESFYDPIEPDYRHDKRIARLVTVGSGWGFHSFAHGPHVYPLPQPLTYAESLTPPGTRGDPAAGGTEAHTTIDCTRATVTARMTADMLEHAKPGSPLAIVAPLGSGKTESALQAVKMLVEKGDGVLIAVPNHELAAEVVERLTREGITAAHARGRGAEIAPGEFMCRRWGIWQDAIKQGTPAWALTGVLCYIQQRDEGHAEKIKCPYYDKCAYISLEKELKEASVVVMMHSHLVAGIPKGIKKEWLFIDESPHEQAVKERGWLASDFSLKPGEISETFGTLNLAEKGEEERFFTFDKKRLVELFETVAREVIAGKGGEMEDGDADYLRKTRDWIRNGTLREASKSGYPALPDSNFAFENSQVVLGSALFQMIRAIERRNENPGSLYAMEKDKKQYIFSAWMELPPRAEMKIVLLDATYRPVIGDALGFGSPRVRRYTVTDAGGFDLVVVPSIPCEQWQTKEPGVVGVICLSLMGLNMPFIGQAEVEKKARLLGLENTAHLKKIKGLDRFKHARGLGVAGRIQPPATALASTVRAMWGGVEGVNFTPEWIKSENALVDAAGNRHDSAPYTHCDFRFANVLAANRDDEAAQAYGRLRTVHASERKVIYHFTDHIPLGVPITRLSARDEWPPECAGTIAELTGTAKVVALSPSALAMFGIKPRTVALYRKTILAWVENYTGPLTPRLIGYQLGVMGDAMEALTFGDDVTTKEGLSVVHSCDLAEVQLLAPQVTVFEAIKRRVAEGEPAPRKRDLMGDSGMKKRSFVRELGRLEGEGVIESKGQRVRLCG